MTTSSNQSPRRLSGGGTGSPKSPKPKPKPKPKSKPEDVSAGLKPVPPPPPFGSMLPLEFTASATSLFGDGCVDIEAESDLSTDDDRDGVVSALALRAMMGRHGSTGSSDSEDQPVQWEHSSTSPSPGLGRRSESFKGSQSPWLRRTGGGGASRSTPVRGVGLARHPSEGALAAKGAAAGIGKPRALRKNTSFGHGAGLAGAHSPLQNSASRRKVPVAPSHERSSSGGRLAPASPAPAPSPFKDMPPESPDIDTNEDEDVGIDSIVEDMSQLQMGGQFSYSVRSPSPEFLSSTPSSYAYLPAPVPASPDNWHGMQEEGAMDTGHGDLLAVPLIDTTRSPSPSTAAAPAATPLRRQHSVPTKLSAAQAGTSPFRTTFSVGTLPTLQSPSLPPVPSPYRSYASAVDGTNPGSGSPQSSRLSPRLPRSKSSGIVNRAAPAVSDAAPGESPLRSLYDELFPPSPLQSPVIKRSPSVYRHSDGRSRRVPASPAQRLAGSEVLASPVVNVSRTDTDSPQLAWSPQKALESASPVSPGIPEEEEEELLYVVGSVIVHAEAEEDVEDARLSEVRVAVLHSLHGCLDLIHARLQSLSNIGSVVSGRSGGETDSLSGVVGVMRLFLSNYRERCCEESGSSNLLAGLMVRFCDEYSRSTNSTEPSELIATLTERYGSEFGTCRAAAPSGPESGGGADTASQHTSCYSVDGSDEEDDDEDDDNDGDIHEDFVAPLMGLREAVEQDCTAEAQGADGGHPDAAFYRYMFQFMGEFQVAFRKKLVRMRTNRNDPALQQLDRAWLGNLLVGYYAEQVVNWGGAHITRIHVCAQRTDPGARDELADLFLCNPHMVQYLVGQLPHQDDRFSSHLVTVLTAIYILFPSGDAEVDVDVDGGAVADGNGPASGVTRSKMLQWLGIMTSDRYTRCLRISQFALSQEIQINDVAYRNDLLDLMSDPAYDSSDCESGSFVTTSGFAQPVLQASIVQSCVGEYAATNGSGCNSSSSVFGNLSGPGRKNANTEEKTVIRRILDSDSQSLELLINIVEWEQLFYLFAVGMLRRYEEIIHCYYQPCRCMPYCLDLGAEAGRMARRHIPSCTEPCEGATASMSAYTRSIMGWQRRMSAVYLNVVQCYGSRLSNKGEPVELPAVLKQLKFALMVLIRLVNTRFYMNPTSSESERVLASFFHRFCARLRQCWPNLARRSASGIADTRLMSMPNVSGEGRENNYIGELAHLQVFGIVLMGLPEQLVLASLRAYERQAGVDERSREAEAHLQGLTSLDEIRLPQRGGSVTAGSVPACESECECECESAAAAASAVAQCLFGLVRLFTSKHFKVATGAMGLLLKQEVVFTRWVANPPYCTRGPSSFGFGEEEYADACEDYTNDDVSTVLIEDMVTCLRQNRGDHWQNHVKSFSAACLNELVELLCSL